MAIMKVPSAVNAGLYDGVPITVTAVTAAALPPVGLVGISFLLHVQAMSMADKAT